MFCRKHMILRNCSPQLHVRLNIKKLLETNTPWGSRSRLEHESAKLGMENRQRCLMISTRCMLQIRHTTSLRREFGVIGQCLQDISLPQRDNHLLVVLVINDHEVFHLVTPEKSISLLGLGLVPYLQ